MRSEDVCDDDDDVQGFERPGVSLKSECYYIENRFGWICCQEREGCFELTGSAEEVVVSLMLDGDLNKGQSFGVSLASVWSCSFAVAVVVRRGSTPNSKPPRI